MTHNYRGRSLSSILTLDIIKDLESDIVSIGKVAENIIPSFISTLENMLNVDLYIDGLENIFSIPEYNDINKAKVFMNMVSRKQELTKLLMNRESGVIVTIGNENDDDIMKDCSLITATYCVDGHCVGKLGVVGPTRMKYDEVTSVVEFLTQNLNSAFKLTEGEEND